MGIITPCLYKVYVNYYLYLSSVNNPAITEGVW